MLSDFKFLLPAGQKYDEEKEEEAALDKKRKQLDKIEKQKLFDDAGGSIQVIAMHLYTELSYHACLFYVHFFHIGKDDKGKKNDSFGEKLATQIIKNLQVKVNRIHVRYEDFYTTPQRPYAVGVTLDSLTFQVDSSNPCCFFLLVQVVLVGSIYSMLFFCF